MSLFAFRRHAARARRRGRCCYAALPHHKFGGRYRLIARSAKGRDRGLAGRPAEPAWRVNAHKKLVAACANINFGVLG